MARDYAKYKQASAKRNRVAHTWQGRLLWVLLVFSLITIISFGIYIDKNNNFSTYKKNMSYWITETKLKFSPHKITNPGLFIKKSASKLTHQEPDIHFSFYTELPTMQVMLLK